jgi:molybdenum cofactor cytidylyltransferase
MTPTLGAIILAAGAGKRLGNLPKCLIRANGQTLRHRLLDALESLRPHEVVLVLGDHASAIEQALRERPASARVNVVHNLVQDEDPASSLHTGLRQLHASVDTVVVLLADQPLLDADDLSQAVQAFLLRAPGQRAMLPCVSGQPGHPVVMERSVARELLNGGIGLRHWRTQHPTTVALWNTRNTHYTCDLDTPGDLEYLRQLTGWHWQLPAAAHARSLPGDSSG